MQYTKSAIWRETGFKMSCNRTSADSVGSHLLRIENLNPQVETQTVLTRWELIRMAAWLAWRAIWK